MDVNNTPTSSSPIERPTHLNADYARICAPARRRELYTNCLISQTRITVCRVLYINPQSSHQFFTSLSHHSITSNRSHNTQHSSPKCVTPCSHSACWLQPQPLSCQPQSEGVYTVRRTAEGEIHESVDTVTDPGHRILPIRDSDNDLAKRENNVRCGCSYPFDHNDCDPAVGDLEN